MFGKNNMISYIFPPVFLAWKIPWTEEPGGLQSTKSKRVGHDRALDSVFVYKHIKHY